MAGGSVGFSKQIHDPAFAGFIKTNNRWSVIIAVVLAVVAVVGFFIYGETGGELDNPQALFIGLGIGGMFLLITLFAGLARRRSKTWDGMVVDKTIEQKSQMQGSGDDAHEHRYTRYTIIIRDLKGGQHRLTADDNDSWYQYFKIGDQVRYHAGLKSYEKYDKSQDSIIYCNACSTRCDINTDYCWRCKCPLLK